MHCSVCQLELGPTEIAAHGDSTAAVMCANCIQASRREMKRKISSNLRRVCDDLGSEVVFVADTDTLVQRSNSNSGSGHKASNVRRPKSRRLSSDSQTRTSQSAYRTPADSDLTNAIDSTALQPTAVDGLRLRIDSAHPRLGEPAEKVSLYEAFESEDHRELDPSRHSIRSARRAISFGLLVFLLGQIAVQWGFFASHFPAWSLGTLFSVGGIAIAFLSVSECFKRVESRIQKR